MNQAWTSLKDHLLFLVFGLSYSILLVISKGKLYAKNYAFIPGDFGPAFMFQICLQIPFWISMVLLTYQTVTFEIARARGEEP